VVRLIFLGPPGAGKGTQAQTVAKLHHIPHISTGDILRSAVAEKTELGLKAQTYMEAGELVPDQLILDLVEARLNQTDARTGWILDGFPRTVNQAIFLESLLERLQQACNHVVNFEVPDEVLVSRLLGRGRTDDTEEVIRNRLEVYHQQTAPLIGFYQERQQLVSVDGDQPIASINQQLNELTQRGPGTGKTSTQAPNS
jgi:adenylate kinase